MASVARRRRFTVGLVTLVGVAALRAAPVAAQAAPAAPAPTPSSSQPLDRVVAVVGSRAILLSDAIESVNAMRAQGTPMPRDSAGQFELLRRVINDLVDNEAVITVAHAYKAEVTDEDVARQVDDQYNESRKRFGSEAEFREALRRDGFGTPEDYRRTIREQAKRYRLQQMGFDSLKAHGRMSAPVQVTEEEVTKAFEASRERLPRRPETVAFRQIVLAPRAAPEARAAARAKAESLLVQLRAGADFENMAKRESMDPGSRDQGGDLGWARRGSGFVPEFERVIFALPPGQLSNVVETSFGFHIIRVDRVQPAEVRSRHILIAAKLDSADVERTKVIADSVLQRWRAGSAYDSLAARYHDPAEERSLLDGFPVDSLPESYREAIAGVGLREFTKPFEIPDVRTGFPKIAVIQVLERREGGEYTVADWRDRIRSQLVQEKQIRRALDQLRKEQYVRILLDEPAPEAVKKVP